MKYMLLLVLAAVTVACVPENYPVTYPPGATLCHSTYDCSGMQYCGFMPGYSAAICRGEGGGNTWVSSNDSGFRFYSR